MSPWKKNIILYFRSYLLTLGASFVAFSVWFAFVNYQRHELLKTLPIIFFIVFLCVGCILASLGVYGPEKKIEVWANSTSKHWASVFISILAYPVYVVWKKIQKKRKA